MSQQKLLDEIAREIEKCKICKVGKVGKAVPGEGDPNAHIVFIGEAPGRTEGETGRPFIGRSGQYLTKLIESIGLDRKDVFITSPVKYFPVTFQGDSFKGRAPTKEEIAHGKVHLEKQIEVIKPKVIVLLGAVAAKALLAQKIKALKDHGKIIKSGKYTYLITLHPAAVLRFQKYHSTVVADFKKLAKLSKSL